MRTYEYIKLKIGWRCTMKDKASGDTYVGEGASKGQAKRVALDAYRMDEVDRWGEMPLEDMR